MRLRSVSTKSNHQETSKNNIQLNYDRMFILGMSFVYNIFILTTFILSVYSSILFGFIKPAITSKCKTCIIKEWIKNCKHSSWSLDTQREGKIYMVII